MRGATCSCKIVLHQRYISIHAPHAGCDATSGRSGRRRVNFNPRTPCGVRPRRFSTHVLIAAFQSTHPMRGATVGCRRGFPFFFISIHAPHAGCDAARNSTSCAACPFQSTHPMRGATCSSSPRYLTSTGFQSTHPMRGATSASACKSPIMAFQSTHPMRGATAALNTYYGGTYISIHAPHAGCDAPRARGHEPLPHFNPRTPCGVRPST